MNYSVSISNATVADNLITFAITGEIFDKSINEGIISKPKLILVFENGKEDRRIPFVLTDVGYFGEKCRFSGEYTYMLDMLFWETRSKHYPFKMYLNLSYGNEYIEHINFTYEPDFVADTNEIPESKMKYPFEFGENEINFTPNLEVINHKSKLRFLRPVVCLFRAIFYAVLYVLGLCLLPIFFIESLFALAGMTKLLVKYDGSVVGAIIGHMNRRLELFSTKKITIRKINRRLILVFYRLFKHRRVVPNKITFISARRNELSGNFEFVYNKLKDDKSLDINFILNNKTLRQLNIIDIVKFCKACATSKVVILDEYTPQIHFIDLKPETKLVQLWHACGAFKTFGFTRLGKPKGSPQKTRNHRSYSYVTVSSKYCKRCHSEGFGIPIDHVVPTGIPRTDVFFDENYKKSVTQKFYAEYPALKDKKIILFAPTFRGDLKESAYYPVERFNIEQICDEIGDEYAIIVKHHPFVRQKQPIPKKYSDRVIDLSDSTEINDLLFVSDLVITDYSSLVFEASLLKVPMLFYAFDLDQYIANRDFYFDLRLNSPGKIVYDQPSLIEAVKNRDFETDRIDAFAKMFFDDFDGKSTDRVVKLIYDAMK